MGQHLGALDYLLPEEYTSTLKVLHSKAPQSSMEEIRLVIQEDLGKEVCFLAIMGAIESICMKDNVKQHSKCITISRFPITLIWKCDITVDAA